MFDIYNKLFPFFDGDLSQFLLEGNTEFKPADVIVYGKLGKTLIKDFILR